jgi:LDH2 family malate/lactate/ureidoglycolate dehydrogenase
LTSSAAPDDRSFPRHLVASGAADPRRLEEFTSLMDGRRREMTQSPPAEGFERVLYAGLPEWEAEQDHPAQGIRVHLEVVEDLAAPASELGVPFDVLR